MNRNVSSADVPFSPFLDGENNLIYFYLIMSYLEGKFDLFLPGVGDLWNSVSNTPSPNLVSFPIVNCAILVQHLTCDNGLIMDEMVYSACN